jgi:hypothetical protein
MPTPVAPKAMPKVCKMIPLRAVQRKKRSTKRWSTFSLNLTDVFQIFAFNKIELLEFTTFASIRPHKKAVKKIEAEGF